MRRLKGIIHFIKGIIHLQLSKIRFLPTSTATITGFSFGIKRVFLTFFQIICICEASTAITDIPISEKARVFSIIEFEKFTKIELSIF